MRHGELDHLPHPPAPSASAAGGIRSYDLPGGTQGRFHMSYGYSWTRCVHGTPCGPIAALTASGGGVLWATDAAVMATPPSGRDSVWLARSPEQPTGIALDDHHVYWTAVVNQYNRGRGQLLCVPLQGGAIEALADGLDWP